MNFYPRYVGDYMRDTAELSLLEHGAYTVLLDAYYSKIGPLPAKNRNLFRICRVQLMSEKKAVLKVADLFFPISEDGLRHNARADEEIAKWQAKSLKNQEVGKLGGRPKKNPDGNPKHNHHGYEKGNPDGFQNKTQMGTMVGTQQKPSPEPEPYLTSQNGSSLTVKSDVSHAQNSSDFARARLDKIPVETKESETERFANWQRFRASYPRGVYPQADFLIAEQLGNLRLDEGATWQEFFDGAERFSAQQKALGNIGTRFVASPKGFFDSLSKKWREPFPLPEPSSGQSTRNGVHKPITWKPTGPDDGAPDVAE